MQIIEANVEDFRRQVQRVLGSSEFVSSRQLREFLSYISEAAFQGRTYLDQAELAEQVLHRGKDFNPLDDASVRKLATSLRQRLDRYYDTDGAADPIRITLPVRSYVPSFEIKEAPIVVPIEPEAMPEAEAPEPTRRGWLLAGASLVGAFTGAGIATAWFTSRRTDDHRPVFVIQTQRGDIMHERDDLAPDAIRLGPAVGAREDVVVRMLFTPERATQQAGLLMFRNVDHYVKLGRQFLSRPQLEFGMELAARYRKPLNTFAYDTEGQTDQPLWLMIRRTGAFYRAFLSNDGLRWRRFGNELEMPDTQEPVRAAIFGHNGRSNAPPAEARFDRFGVGLSFHDIPPGPADLSALPGWSMVNESQVPHVAGYDGECLNLEFAEDAQSYGVDLVRPVRGQDWTVRTRLDFLSMYGSTGGLIARGTKGRFRLIRWDLDGGSITAEYFSHSQVNRKDFEGAPPVILQLQCRNGIIEGSFSRDDHEYHTLPLRVAVKDLTDQDLMVGLHSSKSSWINSEPRPAARFYGIWFDVESVGNFK